MTAAEPSIQQGLSELPGSDKLQDILFSEPRQPQRPPGFAPEEAPVPSRRKSRLQRELVVTPLGSLRVVLIGLHNLDIFTLSRTRL